MPFFRAILLFVLTAHCAAALESAPKALYRERRLALSKKISSRAALLFGASDPTDYTTFRQDSNFYYLTGWNQPGATLLVVAPRPEYPGFPNYSRAYIEILFVAEQPTGKGIRAMFAPDTPGLAEIAGVDRVVSISTLSTELLRLGIRNPDELFTPTVGRPEAATATLAWLQHAMSIVSPGVPYDLDSIMTGLRGVKDEFEVNLLRKAAEASVAGHLAAMHTVKPGMFEYETAALIQYEFQRRGCERPAYAAIAASGANAAFGHYNANSAQMQSGDLVYLDVAGEYSMYAADVTRTLPVNGKYTDRQRELYRIVRGAELAIIQAFQSGKSTLYGSNSLNEVYRAYLTSHGMVKYVASGVGHPVGLNVHDAGETPAGMRAPLGPGSVFNIEPSIYLPEEKTGIGIEDTFWVDTTGKLVNLTAALPVEPEDIERAMAHP